MVQRSRELAKLTIKKKIYTFANNFHTSSTIMTSTTLRHLYTAENLLTESQVKLQFSF